MITFGSVEVDTRSRGTGPSVANEFLEAVEAQLALPAYKQSGFSITSDELKNVLGYTGTAKMTSLVWSINTQFENKQKMIRAGVRKQGKRVAFFNWDGQKREMKPRTKTDDTTEEAPSA